MLVLSRQRDERVMIILPGGMVVPPGGLVLSVLIVDIRGEKIRIGVESPPQVGIHREEVWKRIKQEMAGVPHV